MYITHSVTMCEFLAVYILSMTTNVKHVYLQMGKISLCTAGIGYYEECLRSCASYNAVINDPSISVREH